MSAKKHSRRSALKYMALGGTAALTGSTAYAQVDTTESVAGECNNFVDFSKMSHASPEAALSVTMINGEPVWTQDNPGPLAAKRLEHQITVGFWATPIFNGNGAVQTRHLLTVDVGANPVMGIYHPFAYGVPTQINTITDIYIFDRTNNELLYWKQIGAFDHSPSTMIVLDEGDVAAQRSLRIVARCSLHGLWGRDFQLANPVNYANAVPAPDATKLFSGTTMWRPYSPADPSTDGNQGLGDLHRTRFNLINNNQMTTSIGAGHPHEQTHYIMGGMLFDQNGNVLSPPEHILFSENVVSVGFSNLRLSERGVRTVRGVMFDCLQGMIMSLFDLP